MSTPAEILSARAERWLAEIPGGAPGGVAAKLEPAYERVAQEVAKLDAPTGGQVDWKAVAAGTDELLRTRTKDFTLAAYLARALLAAEGIGGLGVGLQVFAGVCDRYWETGFPELKRLRGRANSAQWLVERACAALGEGGPGGTDLETLRAVDEAARRFAEVLRTRMADAAPAVGPLLETLQRAIITAEAAAPPPQPEPGPAQPAPATAPAPAAAPPQADGPVASPPPTQGFASAEDAVEYLRGVGAGLVTAAAALRASVPADPLGYRLLRTGLWLHLGRPPPAPGGKLGVPPPPENLVNALGLMVQHQRWAALLEEAEAALQQHRYWLDLHRLSAQALLGLGPSHAAAADAVVVELRSFLARMPGLATFTFANGTPVADAQTRSWLDEVVNPAAKGGGSAGAGPAEEALPEDRVAEARALLGAGRVGEGLAALGALVSAQPSGRARFRARLLLARAAAAAGLSGVARGTYESLAAEADQHQLDAWEPALVAECLKGLITAARAAAPGAAGPDLNRQYQRLCRLDPAAAHEIQP
ncbi:MAG: type VI secretion system protein TssA [Anaeromyxobacter sp.]